MFFLVTMLTTIINFWRNLNISKFIFYLKHQVLIWAFWFYSNTLIFYIMHSLLWKHFTKNKLKILLLGVQKTLLAAYALIKIIFESSSLKSQKYVHGHATSSRLTVWLVPCDDAIVFGSCSNSHWDHEAWTLSIIHCLKMASLI